MKNINSIKIAGIGVSCMAVYLLGSSQVLGVMPLTPPSTPPSVKCGINDIKVNRGDCKWNKAKSIEYKCVGGGGQVETKMMVGEKGKCESVSKLKAHAKNDCKSMCKRERKEDKHEKKWWDLRARFEKDD